MSGLTNKRLEEIASGQNTVSISEAVELARELLSLRTLRDAGDDEVRALRYKVDSSASESAEESAALDALESAAITRGQQLREAQAEIEKLNQIIRELKDNFGEMEVGA